MAKPQATWLTAVGQRHPGSVGQDKERPTVSAVRLVGTWTSAHAKDIEALIERLLRDVAKQSHAKVLHIECADIIALDTLGAYLVYRLGQRVTQLAPDVKLSITGLKADQQTLLKEVSLPLAPAAPARPEVGAAYALLSDIGEAVVQAGRDFVNGVGFFGALVVSFGRLLAGRTPLRPASIVTQVERVALRGAPIIILISFLVGAIIAQQSIFQLQSFGTVHFVADLIGILVLRELAVLLSAIMIAGRSGSSFTAELGSMKMREEVDALQTMGLDPMEVLVLPRVLGLMLGLPLLTFMAAMAGIMGGAVVAFVYGGVSFEVFFSRLQNAIGVNTFVVGMLKAPFMALVIGVIACIEGFAVRGSADSLGRHTTASVVKSIFVVIVVDGLFAMFFAAIRY